MDDKNAPKYTYKEGMNAKQKRNLRKKLKKK